MTLGAVTILPNAFYTHRHRKQPEYNEGAPTDDQIQIRLRAFVALPNTTLTWCRPGFSQGRMRKCFMKGSKKSAASGEKKRWISPEFSKGVLNKATSDGLEESL